MEQHLEKRASTLPKQQGKSLVKKSSIVERLYQSPPMKIVGLNTKAIIIMAFFLLGLFNYFVLREMRSLKSEVSQIRNLNQQMSREVTKVVINQPESITKGDLDHRLQLMKNELSYQIEQIQPKENQWVSYTGDLTVFDRFNSIDLKKYVIQNIEAHPDYGRYLAAHSNLEREFDDHLSSLIKDYARNHNITGSDRSEYLRVLAFRDRLKNQYRDLEKESNKKWKTYHNSKRGLSSF